MENQNYILNNFCHFFSFCIYVALKKNSFELLRRAVQLFIFDKKSMMISLSLTGSQNIQDIYPVFT